MKKIDAVFYKTDAGNEPVRNWLRKQSEPDRKTIGKDIRTVEYGWPVGMPVCDSLGRALWEVRSNISDDRIARVIFCIKGKKMVLLHGFIKKAQKTPKPDMDLAVKRKRDLK